MKKRVKILVTAVGVLFSVALAPCLPVGTALALAINFPDVAPTNPHATAIQNLKDAGVIAGYGDGTFQPDKTISRAESVAIILKATGVTATKTSATLPFTDVPETEWYFPMIQKGVALGKLKGYGDKTFRPLNPVTLPEALALTLGFYNVSTKNTAVDPVIYDGLDTHDWYAKFAQYAKDKNLFEPDEKGLVDAKKSLTRAELAELIYRMRIVAQTGQEFNITSLWITTEHQENFWRLRHPADFEIFKGQQNSVIWKRAPGQAFFTRVWPGTVRLSISVVANPENLGYSAYFAKIRQLYATNYADFKPAFSEKTLSGRPVLGIALPERHLLDQFIQLPNRNFLTMYGEYGEAPIGEFYKKQLELIELSYQYVEPPAVLPPPPLPPLADRMETLRENILVAGKWPVVAPLFRDKHLIHTDAIGIGTGPVDYYFSAEASTTIKLERNSGTVLNVKDGQTTAF